MTLNLSAQKRQDRRFFTMALAASGALALVFAVLALLGESHLSALVLAYGALQGMLFGLLWAARRGMADCIRAAVDAEHRAQLSLSQATRRNEQLLMALGEGVYGVDRKGRGVFMNRAALDMLGLTKAEVIGANQHALFHHHRPDGRAYPIRECPVTQTLEDGQARHVDNEWFWHKDGHGFPVRLTITPTEEDGEHSGAVVVFQDITEQKKRDEELNRLATIDSMTGLPNRRCLLEHIDQELARFQRTQQPGALLMLDLDHFKRVNDRYGHATGDAVLEHFAGLIRGHLRRIDFAGRLGGEEFVVVLVDTPADGARVFAQRLCDAVAATPLDHDDGPLRYTVSIGLATFEPCDAGSDTLLARADAALYRAKQRGRNRVEVAEATPPTATGPTATAQPSSDSSHP